MLLDAVVDEYVFVLLVDELGGLGDALKWVAQQAKLKDGDYTTGEYPSLEMSFMDMFGTMYSIKQEQDLRQRMGLFYTTWQQLQVIMGREKVLCLMEPIEIVF